jgi:transposase
MSLSPPWIVEGAMDGRTFDSYIRTQLAPCLRRGDVVIPATNFVRADNLNVHKSPRAAQALAERGAWFLFLPKYSADLNPIEQAFAKLKTLLRKAKARTYDALWRTVSQQYLQPLRTTGMLELSQARRLCCRLIARRSKAYIGEAWDQGLRFLPSNRDRWNDCRPRRDYPRSNTTPMRGRLRRGPALP